MKNIFLLIMIVVSISANANFCGSSTFGNCNTSRDCTTGGCSGQICQSVFEPGIATTCQWLDCYKKTNVTCQCVNQHCQWTTESKEEDNIWIGDIEY